MRVPPDALVGQYMQTLLEFPLRQRPDSFTVDDVMEKLQHHKEALETASAPPEGSAKRLRASA